MNVFGNICRNQDYFFNCLIKILFAVFIIVYCDLNGDVTMTLSIIVSMSKISIIEFEEKHIQDVSRVLAKSFISLNSAWKNSKLPYSQVYRIMRGKILPALQSLMTFVILQDDKLIGVSVSYDMLQTLNMPTMPNYVDFLKKLGKAGQQLQRSLDLSQFKKGDLIYGLYAVIDPDYANKGYSLRFWWQCLSIGKVAGWKYYYSRISSPISLKMLQKLGAQIVGQVDFVDGDLKEKFWMVRLDFSKPFPSYSMLKQMTKQNKNKEVRAKL